jgi:16S rRNA (cytidine1402-2'-O)-methyltransferase
VEAGVTPGGSGTLYVVSTPIGNLGDFSYRAVEILTSVAAVLAEDTRHSRHLLDRYAIATPLVPYHEHNEAKTTPRLPARRSSRIPAAGSFARPSMPEWP